MNSSIESENKDTDIGSSQCGDGENCSENVRKEDDVEREKPSKKRRDPSGFSKLRNIHKEAREKIKQGVIEELKNHGISEASDRIVDSMVDDITGSVRRRELRNSVVSRLRTATLVLMFVVLFLLMMFIIKLDGKFIEKSLVKQSISQAISNDADLNELKIIFSFKSEPTQDIFGPLIKSSGYYKVDNLTLQHILDELKVDLLTSSEFDDDNRKLRTSLDAALEEYLKINPFEGLDDNDKKDLSNITIKLGADSYKIIQPEIEGLTESLKVKNSLIREYLNSSNMSLYISMSAFVFSILVVVWQFLPNAKASQRQLITEAIKEHSEGIVKNRKNED